MWRFIVACAPLKSSRMISSYTILQKHLSCCMNFTFGKWKYTIVVMSTWLNSKLTAARIQSIFFPHNYLNIKYKKTKRENETEKNRRNNVGKLISEHAMKQTTVVKLIQTGHFSQTGATGYCIVLSKSHGKPRRTMHFKHFYDFIQFQFGYETCMSNN